MMLNRVELEKLEHFKHKIWDIQREVNIDLEEGQDIRESDLYHLGKKNLHAKNLELEKR